MQTPTPTQYVEQLADRATLVGAWMALKDAGEAALPAIREGLSHPEWRVRQWSAMFLDHNWDLPSLQRLVLTLNDPKLKVRKAAVHSLGCDRCKNGENPIDAVPHLARRLRDDPSIKVRRTAVLTLAIQKPERRVASILRRVLRDETDPKMRAYATWGIGRYDEAIRGASATPS
jgi:HEAT repeat protein